MPLPIDPAAIWTAIQAIQGNSPGAGTPNTTTGYVTDAFNPGGGGPPSGGIPGQGGPAGGPSTGGDFNRGAPNVTPNPSPPGAPTPPGAPAPPGGSPPGGVPGEPWRNGSGQGEDVWGNPDTQDGPDAWFAKAVLKGMSDPAYMKHLLASVTGPNGPPGSLYQHYYNLIVGVMNGNADKIAEAKYYATNPSDPYGPGASNNGPGNG